MILQHSSCRPLKTTQLYMQLVVATVGAKKLNAVLSGYGFLITIVGSRQRLL